MSYFVMMKRAGLGKFLDDQTIDGATGTIDDVWIKAKWVEYALRGGRLEINKKGIIDNNASVPATEDKDK